MGRMKDLHIEQMNKEVEQSGYPKWMLDMYGFNPSVCIEEIESPPVQIPGASDHIWDTVAEKSLGRIISDNTPQEVKDRVNDYADSLLAEYNQLNELNTAELSHLLDYENFKQSGKGQDYCAYFGNWEDAYDKYLYDLGYYQQEQDIDHLCRLNGYED
jgi:hypothetical protein